MKFKHHRKIKRYRKISFFEYAVIFNSSNKLIEFICHIKSANIINSNLYTKDGCYQLIITANSAQHFKHNIVFKDKSHIDEIKLTSRLICKSNAVSKMQKAFKAT